MKKSLKEIRNEKGLKANFVARKLNITTQLLYAYENYRTRITAYMFIELCKIYGVDPMQVYIPVIKYGDVVKKSK